MGGSEEQMLWFPAEAGDKGMAARGFFIVVIYA